MRSRATRTEETPESSNLRPTQTQRGTENKALPETPAKDTARVRVAQRTDRHRRSQRKAEAVSEGSVTEMWHTSRNGSRRSATRSGPGRGAGTARRSGGSPYLGHAIPHDPEAGCPGAPPARRLESAGFTAVRLAQAQSLQPDGEPGARRPRSCPAFPSRRCHRPPTPGPGGK